MRYSFENYSLDIDRRELRRADHLISIEPQIFDLLQYLIRNRERVVSRDDLIAAVWNRRIVSESTLSSRVNAVRSAIGDNGKDQRLIRTFSKKGVRFIGAIERDEEFTCAGDETRLPPVLPDNPSIAVLPFKDLGGEVSHNYFSDGITADIITELSRFSDLFVIARNSSFQYKEKPVDARQIGRELGVRYLLEGSVQRAGDRVRITVQLVDAATCVNCWAERYDRKLDDVFAVQDEIARRIVTTLVSHVNKAEANRTLLKPASTWQAYDYYLRAAEALNAWWLSPTKAANLYETRRLLKRSLSIEPDYARAHALLADTYISAYQAPLDADYINSEALERAHRSACDALRSDSHLPLAHALMGFVLGFKRHHDASIVELERAIALNPNYTDWRFAMTFVMAGDHLRAVDAAQAHLRADPFYPPRAAFWLGVAYYMLRKYSEAIPHFREAASRAPNSGGAHRWCAANYAQLKRFDEAQTELAAALRIDPKFTLELQRRLAAVCRYEEDSEHSVDGLRKAGLREK